MADSEVSALTESTAPADDDIFYLTNAGGTIDRKVKVSTVRQTKTVFKTADESVTSSTVLQDDNELFVALLANTNYVFECFIYATTSATTSDGDMKVGFTVPAGVTDFGWRSIGADGTGSLSQYGLVTASGNSVAAPSLSSSSKSWLHVVGWVRNGANAGNLQLQWAQNSSDTDASNVKAGSWLRITREG